MSLVQLLHYCPVKYLLNTSIMVKRTLEEQKQSLLNRLLLHRHINADTNCWEWTGKSQTKDGYGVLGSTIEDRNHIYAHRASWIVHFGTIPECSVICHECDNPKCFNPDHLWIGTPAENMLDKIFKGRHTKTETVTLLEQRLDQITNLLAEYGLSKNQITSIVKLITTYRI